MKKINKLRIRELEMYELENALGSDGKDPVGDNPCFIGLEVFSASDEFECHPGPDPNP
jgi:hypothetical protein